MASGTTSPAPSSTRPRIQMPPGVPSAAAHTPSAQVRPMARYGPTVALGVRPNRRGSVRKPVPRCPERGWEGSGTAGTSSGFMPYLQRDSAPRSAPRSLALPAMLPRLSSRDVSVVVGLEGGLGRAAQHDVPLEGQRPVVLGALEGVPADRPVPGDWWDRVEDRVLTEQRVVREV